MDAGQVTGTYRMIMAAVARGALSPASAIRWARLAAAGEDVSVVGELAAVPGVAGDNRRVAAAAPDLAQQVIDALMPLLDAARQAADVPAEWPILFPPGSYGPSSHYPAVNPPLVYDGDQQGRRNRTATTWDGYTQAARRDQRFAVVSGPEDASGPDELSDAEADELWPPSTIEEAEARHQAREVAAGQLLYYDDEELHAFLFGDTSGPDAG